MNLDYTLLKLIECAQNLEKAANNTYNSKGLNLTELKIAIEEFKLADRDHKEQEELFIQQFNEYYKN